MASNSAAFVTPTAVNKSQSFYSSEIRPAGTDTLLRQGRSGHKYLGRGNAPPNRRRVRWCKGGVSPPSPRGMGSVLSPQRGPGWRTPTRKAFWRILKDRTLLLHVYADSLSSSNRVSCHIWRKAEVRGNFFYYYYYARWQPDIVIHNTTQLYKN